MERGLAGRSRGSGGGRGAGCICVQLQVRRRKGKRAGVQVAAWFSGQDTELLAGHGRPPPLSLLSKPLAISPWILIPEGGLTMCIHQGNGPVSHSEQLMEVVAVT